jgi:hypothetical protein
VTTTNALEAVAIAAMIWVVEAAGKLQDLQLATDAALDAQRSSNGRLQALPRDADQRMRDALTAERDKHGARGRGRAQERREADLMRSRPRALRSRPCTNNWTR